MLLLSLLPLLTHALFTPGGPPSCAALAAPYLLRADKKLPPALGTSLLPLLSPGTLLAAAVTSTAASLWLLLPRGLTGTAERTSRWLGSLLGLAALACFIATGHRLGGLGDEAVFLIVSLVAVIYVGLVAMVQKDMKKLVAYSSVAHMGFVTLGFFVFSDLGVSGGIVQMIAHGFVSAAMFLCIGVLYDRVHSREIASYGGVVNTMPRFTAFALLFAMANCGLPATAGFVGEWMVILAAVKANFWLGLGAATALIFGAAYTLWMFKRVYLGAVANDDVKGLSDINAREFLTLTLLAIPVLYMGVYPKPFTDVMNSSVAELLKHVALTKLN
jgi:formate hydrogenlyase subunit 3/multisubunit Na+/H+ antiporter MnhD subunit